MLAETGLLAAAARREKGAWTVFPAAFTRKYQLGTAAVLGFFLVTLGVTGVDTPARLLSLVYNAVVTVVFEELLFRGFFYRVLSREKNEKAALFLSALLFGLWHLGYADTVLWRAALFFPGRQCQDGFCRMALRDRISDQVPGSQSHGIYGKRGFMGL